jgi:hypothetical protein
VFVVSNMKLAEGHAGFRHYEFICMSNLWWRTKINDRCRAEDERSNINAVNVEHLLNVLVCSSVNADICYFILTEL